MCGLAGIFNHRSGEPVSRGDLEGMARRIAHRGPDGEGFYLDGALGFAHRRLAILDREGGAQPMISAAGTVLVVNGEIYNYQEIFAELKRRGRSPETRSDTEALLLAYDEWGLEFVDRLTGMFALALWDARRRRLVLCRDRLGIKPLYLAETPAGLVFGSEVKALWSLPGVDASIDVTALDEYMSLGFVLGPRTMMRGVRKLDAGTLVTVEMGGRPAARRYWSLRFDPDPVPDARAWADEVRAVFEDVTRLHLLRDVPLGVLLSGGLDSSVIAATVAQRPDVCSLESFTVSVDIPGAISEQRWARQVADAVGATHHHGVAAIKFSLNGAHAGREQGAARGERAGGAGVDQNFAQRRQAAGDPAFAGGAAFRHGQEPGACGAVQQRRQGPIHIAHRDRHRAAGLRGNPRRHQLGAHAAG